MTMLDTKTHRDPLATALDERLPVAVNMLCEDLGEIGKAAIRAAEAVGHNRPMTSADQARLVIACQRVLCSLGTYQTLALMAEDLRPSGAVVVPLGLVDDDDPSLVRCTMPVSEVPVDGSVDVRTCPPASSGRYGPWGHVIGETLRAVGGDENRSLIIEALPEPWTFHVDQCVQVRPAGGA